MPNTREKLIEKLEASRNNDGTGREMRFTGGDVTPVVRSCLTIQKWIPVTERLPETSGRVLAHVKGVKQNKLAFAVYENEKWWDLLNFYPADVTHWMPLPEPPEGE